MRVSQCRGIISQEIGSVENRPIEISTGQHMADAHSPEEGDNALAARTTRSHTMETVETSARKENPSPLPLPKPNRA